MTAVTPPVSRHLTVPETAERLGVTPRTVYRFMREHGLPYVTPGGGDRRVPENQLAAWLDRQPGPRVRPDNRHLHAV